MIQSRRRLTPDASLSSCSGEKRGSFESKESPAASTGTSLSGRSSDDKDCREIYQQSNESDDKALFEEEHQL